jgi:hypothetical protein
MPVEAARRTVAQIIKIATMLTVETTLPQIESKPQTGIAFRGNPAFSHSVHRSGACFTASTTAE